MSYVPAANARVLTTQRQRKSSQRSVEWAAGQFSSFPFQRCRPVVIFIPATCQQQSTPSCVRHICDFTQQRQHKQQAANARIWERTQRKSPTWQTGSWLRRATARRQSSLPLREDSSSPKLPATVVFLLGYLNPKDRHVLQVQENPIFSSLP